MKPDIFPYPLQRIGIIGGGQLGKMSALSAKEKGFYVTVLDPDPQCPAAPIADAHIVGDLYDPKKICALACLSDVLTYEVEHIDVETLIALQADGQAIFPSPHLLAIIQDKFLQKQELLKNDIPVAACQSDVVLTPEFFAQARYPFVQKARKGGYDGKGVAVFKSPADAHKALNVPYFLEEYIDFEKELAVIVARGQAGEVACYPVVEMVFDERTNICDIVAAPARVDARIHEVAQAVAIQAITRLGGVGIFGVEMFLTRAGEVLVNEIAPRPHNSGHYTIEGCITSQFDQLIRIISGLPLGSTQLLKPAVMLNLLGEEGFTGVPMIEGLHAAMNIAGLSFHLYDKKTTRPFRKMGHITVLDDDLTRALQKVDEARRLIKIKAKV